MIIQGSHRIIKITCEKDMEHIQDVKIMFYNKNRILKSYSKEDIQINRNIVSIVLTQTDTMSFDVGTAYMEMKYLDEDGLVEVSRVKKLYVDARKDDRELEGTSIGNPIEDNFEIDESGNIIINKSSSGVGVTNEELEAAVKEYFEAHKEELKGEPGAEGYTPQKDKDYFDGAPGEKGDPGENGYTPIKGTDYWTAEDIAEIQSYIDTQIGGALDGSY